MSEMNEFEHHEEAEAELHKPVPVADTSSSGKCCLYGCLFGILFALLVIVGGGLATFWFVKGQVNKYTSVEPADIPVVEYSEEELDQLENRIDSFKEEIEEGGAPDDLVLSSEDINALIAKDDDLRGKVFVTIENGQISGDISIPTDALPGGDGRYFNASATFDVSLQNSILIVTLDDAAVNGEPVPDQFLEAMRSENLAKEADKDPEFRERLSQFESLTVEGDKIILKPRQRETMPEMPAEEMPAEEMPAEEMPAEEVSGEEVSGEEVSGEEAPAAKSPAAADAPAGEAAAPDGADAVKPASEAEEAAAADTSETS